MLPSPEVMMEVLVPPERLMPSEPSPLAFRVRRVMSMLLPSAIPALNTPLALMPLVASRMMSLLAPSSSLSKTKNSVGASAKLT